MVVLNRFNNISISVLAALLSMTPQTLVFADNISINNEPLTGVAIQYSPNIVLALSVEYPTAKSAYPNNDKLNRDMLKQRYNGYFDNTKCYQYQVTRWDGNHQEGYFYPIYASWDTTEGYVGLCSDNAYSGNAMNFITMSAIDVFRSAMTGGNRAYGTASNDWNYQSGDTSTETYLRRAYMEDKDNEGDKNAFSKEVDVNSFKTGWIGLSKFFPKDLVYYNNKLLTYLKFNNKNGFSIDIDRGNNKDKINYLRLDSVIKVCDPSVGLESNCVRYGNNDKPIYKPEGLLQKYGCQGMRVAVFGYLNRNDRYIDGGVLRARMKDLTKDETVKADNQQEYRLTREWDPQTGIFAVNPDQTDASQSAGSAVNNSGVINYVNKFGDISGYKRYDPGAELYYTALRYLRHGVWDNNGQRINTPAAPYQVNNIKREEADGFPVIYQWDDPLSVPGNACRQNTIIFLGDTGTNDDQYLPNFGNWCSQDLDKDDIQTKTSLQQLINDEKSNFSWDTNVGARSSAAGIAGLAYWARTHDLRPDIQGNQFGNNFMIDVVESNNYRGGNRSQVRNSYYLAAKYGGFDRNLTTNDNPNSKRESWTNDQSGQTSISQFSDGVPRNFATANDPEKMINALTLAFNTVNAKPLTAQAAMNFVSTEPKINLRNGAIGVQSSYNGNDWTGNVYANKITIEGGKTTSTRLWDAASSLNNAYHNTTGWNRRVVYTRNGRFTGDSGSLHAFILGDTSQEGGTYRKRNSLLGTVIYSGVTPILPQATTPTGCSYANADDVKNRPAAFAFAANDGMLHMLDQNGKETWAYLPSTVTEDKLAAYAAPEYKHQFLNDGTPVTAELCDGNTAKSYLVGTTGRGGAAVYAFDVTQPSTTPNILWEFTDAGLGLTISKPILTRDHQGRPIAIFSSGYNSSDGKGYLYVISLKNGTIINKVALDNSGVGAPFGYDANNDGSVDRVYVGDHDGKLWRVDQDNNGTWAIPQSLGNKPLFIPENKKAPIMGAPYAELIHGTLYVVVGTGEYFNTDDLDNTKQNYAYGFFDKGIVIDATSSSQSVLLNQTISEKDVLRPAGSTISYYTVSKNTLSPNHQGWRLRLLPGQVISSAASILKHQVANFFASRKTSSTDQCASISGATALIAVDVTNGGLYDKAPLFDTNDDGLFGKEDGYFGMAEVNGILAPEGTVTDDGTVVTGGQVLPTHLNTRLGNKVSIRRISWREIPLTYQYR